MPKQLHLYVSGGPDSDDERRAVLTDRLRSELQARGVDAHRPSTTLPPDGTKGSALEWAELVVALTGTLPVVIGAIRAWLRRHEDTSITVSIDGDELTIDDPSDAERAELLRAWLDRHGGD